MVIPSHEWISLCLRRQFVSVSDIENLKLNAIEIWLNDCFVQVAKAPG